MSALSFLSLSRFRRHDIDGELRKASHWAKDAWRDHWAVDGDDLQTALDAFLPDAYDHALSTYDLSGVYSARITRAILIGIGDSGTHPKDEYEAALGVPMPVEKNR